MKKQAAIILFLSVQFWHSNSFAIDFLQCKAAKDIQVALSEKIAVEDKNHNTLFVYEYCRNLFKSGYSPDRVFTAEMDLLFNRKVPDIVEPELSSMISRCRLERQSRVSVSPDAQRLRLQLKKVRDQSIKIGCPPDY
jgi:hypothetical protein